MGVSVYPNGRSFICRRELAKKSVHHGENQRCPLIGHVVIYQVSGKLLVVFGSRMES